MVIIDTIQHFIHGLTKRSFYLFLAGILAGISLISVVIVYRYYTQTKALTLQLRRLNKDREEAQQLLSKDLEIKKQRAIVEQMFNKNKNFKLREYFDTVIHKLNLEPYVKEVQLSVNNLENVRAEGYTEIRLTASLTNINIQHLVQLLNEIEQNELVFTKRIEITKSATLPVIDAEIIIATLQPKAE